MNIASAVLSLILKLNNNYYYIKYNLQIDPFSVQKEMGESFTFVLIFPVYTIYWPTTFCQAAYFVYSALHGSIVYLSLLKVSQLIPKLHLFYFYCLILWAASWQHKVRICFVRFFFCFGCLIMYQLWKYGSSYGLTYRSNICVCICTSLYFANTSNFTHSQCPNFSYALRVLVQNCIYLFYEGQSMIVSNRTAENVKVCFLFLNSLG